MPIAAPAAQAPTDTLVLVNGEPITVGYLDEMLAQLHQSGNMANVTAANMRMLLEKRINDLLVLQDASAMGLDEEAEIVEEVHRRTARRAVNAYVSDNIAPPGVAPEDSVRAYFERFYWQLEYRQLTVLDADLAERLREEILAGAAMDSLIREFSVDSKKHRDGLSGEVYWADVEIGFRDQLRELDIGELSRMFPVGEGRAFVRLERRFPVDEDSFAELAPRVRAIVQQDTRARAWDAFIADVADELGLNEHPMALARVIADSAKVLTPAFTIHDPEPVFELADGSAVTGTQFRKALLDAARSNLYVPFSGNLNDTRRSVIRDLLLTSAARRDGYFERLDIVAQAQRDLEDLIVEKYLEENISPRVVFNRQEFETYYEENRERYRGAEQVRLSLLVLNSQTDADDVAARLNAGADFTRIWNEYMHVDSGPPVSSFIAETEMSPDIRAALRTMSPGDTSNPLRIGTGYLVFQLDERKPGRLPSMAEMEMDIRKVMFQRKVRVLLDEQFAILKSQSDIRRWPERIEAYFAPLPEDQQ